ncbi:MAG: Spy/CpxP family protein refolding chaperone [Helicobacteraceae bacterium]|jgi:Spy/CpxP family protein refolding chaperone|nr:Spy/CpxP family protein refolding chaperone [Helicobacteraceae bacterium]
MKRIFLCAAILAALSVAGFANWQRDHSFFDDKSLNLSEAQKEKLQTLRSTCAESPKNVDRSGAKSDFADAFKAENFDRAAFLAAATANATKHAEERANFLAELHAVFTPEQREVFAQNLDQRGDRRDGFGFCGTHKSRGVSGDQK